MPITRPQWYTGPAWKMVNVLGDRGEPVAEFVAAGSLRIGTLGRYAKIDNGRADQLDGSLLTAVEHLDSDRAGSWDELGRFGSRFSQPQPGGRIVINNSILGERSSPCWVLCLSEVGNTHDPDPTKPKAIFQIADVMRLASHLQKRFPERLGGFFVNHVSYQPRIVSLAEGQTASATPFIKDLEFAPEKEIRLVFEAVDPSALLHEDCFDTGNDPVTAAMLRRIV